MPFALACIMAVAGVAAAAAPQPRRKMTPEEIADHLLMIKHRQNRPVGSEPSYHPSAGTHTQSASSGIDPFTYGVIGYAVGLASQSSSDSGGGYVDSGSWSSSE